MTDTTLYAGLVGQKLHGTIRTNGLAYGGAMKIGNFLNVRVGFGLLIALGFPLELLFIMMGNVAGILITPVVLAGLGFLVFRPATDGHWANPDKTLGQRIGEESPSSFTHPVGRWDL